MIVLGVDTGYASLGWALVNIDGPKVIDCGTVRTSGKDTDARMVTIGSAIIEVRALVNLLAAEDPYGPLQGALRFGKCNAQNFKNIEVFGMLRGIALGRCIPFRTIHSKSAKIAVCGKGGGNADKAQVKRAVQAIPGCPKRLSEHAADAIAIAICAGRRERVER